MQDENQGALADQRRRTAEQEASRQIELRELLATGDAFELLVGHRPLRRNHDGLVLMFVEPVAAGLPLQTLISEVRYQMHPSSCVRTAVAKGSDLTR